ncbi:hypothetical protein Adt_41671 [Abeliophyllum distichum]|uniref:Uncharacterized protein n=1 Tax=Abeliophyllum distichum TaxID=126358 RepID=A0ABD1PPM1_9LAMI
MKGSLRDYRVKKQLICEESCIPTTLVWLLWRKKCCATWRSLRSVRPRKIRTIKGIEALQFLLDKATVASKKKDGEIDQLHKEVDQLHKCLEIVGDEAITRYKMSTEYQSSLHMYGAESLKVAINMTKEWLVDEHLEISPICSEGQDD